MKSQLYIRLFVLAMIPFFTLAGACAASLQSMEGIPRIDDHKESSYSLRYRGTAFFTKAFLETHREDWNLFTRIEWAKTPSVRDLPPLYTDDMEQRAYAVAKCSMSSDGALTGCKIDVMQPASPAFEQMYLALTAMFRPSEAFVRQYGGVIRWVTIDFAVTNDNGKPNAQNPCVSSFCSIIPPPPPPPPPSDEVQLR